VTIKPKHRETERGEKKRKGGKERNIEPEMERKRERESILSVIILSHQ
jgi:hypothetical protein